MKVCNEAKALPAADVREIRKLIDRMSGSANIADVVVSPAGIKGYRFRIEVLKYNSRKGWATVGYVYQDKQGSWHLSYKPKGAGAATKYTGRTQAYN